MRSTPVRVRSDLTTAYVDPRTAPGILAYCQETHADESCHRALRKGHTILLADVDRDSILWCETCTVEPGSTTNHP